MAQKVAELGIRGEKWLAGLADLIADLEQRWSITVGQPLTGGSSSYVARARTADGQEAVIKLAIPDPEFASEVRTIASAQGCGYAVLLAHDAARHAMLQESLGAAMDDLDMAPERQIEALCQTLRQAWRVPPPAGATVTPETEKARRLGELVRQLWEQLDRPCPQRVITRALQFAERRTAAFDLQRCVVVHGDPHPGNALQVRTPRAEAKSGFVFVDPDGFLAEPAYDLGVVLRDWCVQLLGGDAFAVARRYCGLLAAHTELDETAIWEWGYLERVSTGLYTLQLGAQDIGRRFLQTAEMLVQ